MVEPGAGAAVGGAPGAERSDCTLAYKFYRISVYFLRLTDRAVMNHTDDGANLAGRGRDTVRGGTVPSRETLAGHNEGGRVGAEVEEKLREHIDGQQTVLSELVVSEAHDDEENSENSKASKLNGLTADGVNSGDGNPVARDGTGHDDDEISDGCVVQIFVDVLVVARRVSNSLQNGGIVQGQTIVSNIEEEPRESSTSEQHAVLGLGVVAHEVAEAGLLHLHRLIGVLSGSDTGDTIDISLAPLATNVVLGVLIGLLNILLDIKRVPRGLRDGQTVVEGNDSWNGTKTDQSSPHLIYCHDAVTSTGLYRRGSLQGPLEAEGNEEHDEGGAELANALHGEDGSHHGASPLGGRELGGNDGRQRVVTTDADTHQHTPEDDDADNVDRRRVAGKSVGEGSEDNDHQLHAVHALTTDLERDC